MEEQGLPRAIEAEQGVLGSILIDARCLRDVVGKVEKNDLCVDMDRDLFEIIMEMYAGNEEIDPVTVIDRMRGKSAYDEKAMTGYIKQLMEVTPTAANAGQYAAIVRDRSLRRKLAQVASEIGEAARHAPGSAQEALEDAERRLYELREGCSTGALEPVGDILLRVYDELDRRARAGRDIPGIPTGYRALDKKINGLNKTDLILIAGRPGMGKTALGLNIAQHVSKTERDKSIVFFSLEMSREQLVARLLSCEGYLEGRLLQTASMSEEEWSRLGIAASAISQMKLLVDDDPVVPVPEMTAKCRQVGDLGLVIVDHLQSIASSGRAENRVQAVSEISRGLKIMAKKLNVPVVCLCQLSRAVEARADKRPLLSDLRDSGAIEQDADIVLFLYRDDYYNKASGEPGVCECIVAKNRHGETGTVKLRWRGQFTSFEDMDG